MQRGVYGVAALFGCVIALAWVLLGFPLSWAPLAGVVAFCLFVGAERLGYQDGPR